MLHRDPRPGSEPSDGSEVIVGCGVLRLGPLTTEYTTGQPAPTQWVAVGVVTWMPGRPTRRNAIRMLVECGATEDEAVKDLSERLDALCKRVFGRAGERPADVMPATASSRHEPLERNNVIRAKEGPAAAAACGLSGADGQADAPR
jgi:hypothetical protein